MNTELLVNDYTPFTLHQQYFETFTNESNLQLNDKPGFEKIIQKIIEFKQHESGACVIFGHGPVKSFEMV